MGASSADFRGNLPPISVPEKPAIRVSPRHTSSGVSPPSDGRSSLVQVIGLMPRRTAMLPPWCRQESRLWTTEQTLWQAPLCGYGASTRVVNRQEVSEHDQRLRL